MLTPRNIEGGSAKPVSIVYGGQVAKLENNALAVVIQDQYTELIDIYLHRTEATPTLTSDIDVDDTVFSIDTNANIDTGDALTIMEDDDIYQSIVVSSTENSVTVVTPCDKAFTTAASVRVGTWNMAVNGSSTPVEFVFYAPPTAEYDIYSITITGLGDTDVEIDGTTFISIADGITNGFLLRFMNGEYKNLGLFVNNLGFTEFGFDVSYVGANKKSEYGLIANKNIKVNNGVSIRVVGSDDDLFEAVVSDNLSSESLLTVIVHGHKVE